ncbi:helix-turn-helix domain-containing protein [Amnibacterium kyonggiense]|uniref:Transcriptional regulator with XRE-family HTH domain n=1 Tax=Amnibacterium kyonggiense TaxID=595671 RepID=A0A4R7FM88_9MICO|nr:helix-turn-helix transcriptional regulator [Amnibacterium kyonggiense]TDS77571.1 transcriptional regulator with XRE-family HTH domain [Amnibacterium kyonggiense]
MRIAALRRERGWTQEHLASVSGVGVRTVQRLEAGEDGSLETLRRVAAALEVPVPELFAASASPGDSGEIEATTVPVGPAEVTASARAERRGSPRGAARIAVLIGVLALAGSLAGAAVGAVRPAGFEASVQLYASSDGGASVYLLSEATYAQEAARSYAALVEEPVVLNRAAARLGQDGRDLPGSVVARVEPGTVVLAVTARGSTPLSAERRVDAVVQSLIEVVGLVTPEGPNERVRLRQIDGPRISTDSGWFVGIASLGGIGLGGGLLVGLIVALIRRRPLDPPGAVGRLAIP